MALFQLEHSHGGQLKQASKQYGIALEEWVDLSTGISPFTYPLSEVPKKCWQRLPETNDGLESAAARYYGSDYLLPVAGSQEAIQRLPTLFEKKLTIGIAAPAYHSHQQAWQAAGHTLKLLEPHEIEAQLGDLDALLIVNPTNPTTQLYARDVLLDWHQQLAAHNGVLIVDEAFIDTQPHISVIDAMPKKGLIVLRSIGKFFGLAGIRLGFVWATKDILQGLAQHQHDWGVSHVARWAGKTALADSN